MELLPLCIYLASLVLFLFVLYFDKGIVTVRHFINWFWIAFIPLVNTFFAVGIIMMIVEKYLREKYQLPRISEKWDNLLDKKLYK
jgi:hypothetical protein